MAKRNKNDFEELHLPGFAFYKYKRNKNNAHSIPEERDKDFSLSVVTTNLATPYETELRNFVARRASKGSLLGGGQGTINSITFGEFTSSSEHQITVTDTLCYCGLLSHEKDELSEIISSDSGRNFSEEFIVCLLTKSNIDLDLFRSELDSYSKKLLNLIEPDLEGFDDRVQNILETWYEDCTHYLSNCVITFEEDIKYLLYYALLDTKIDIQIPDKKLAADVVRFLECCSLSELVTSKSSDNLSDTSSSISDTVLVDIKGCSVNPACDNKPALSQSNDGKFVFNNCACSEFCEDWSASLVNADFDKPVIMKQIIESYKLRAIQDLNNLKRMIKQAESDYYALFRVYITLSRSGNSSVLLRHTYSEASSHGQKDTLNTLSALNNFIQEMKSQDIKT